MSMGQGFIPFFRRYEYVDTAWDHGLGTLGKVERACSLLFHRFLLECVSNIGFAT